VPFTLTIRCIRFSAFSAGKRGGFPAVFLRVQRAPTARRYLCLHFTIYMEGKSTCMRSFFYWQDTGITFSEKRCQIPVVPESQGLSSRHSHYARFHHFARFTSCALIMFTNIYLFCKQKNVFENLGDKFSRLPGLCGNRGLFYFQGSEFTAYQVLYQCFFR